MASKPCNKWIIVFTFTETFQQQKQINTKVSLFVVMHECIHVCVCVKVYVLYYAPNSHGIEGSLKRSTEISNITWVRYLQVYADYTYKARKTCS